MSDLTITIDTREIEQFAEVLGKAPQIAGKEINATMEASLNALEQAIATRTPVNTGQLRGSITHEVRGTPAHLRGEVFTPLIYGWPMEKGRRPGKMPPVAAISLWLYRKGIVTDPKEMRSVGFAVARAIAAGRTRHQRKGGDKMFEKGFEAAEPLIVDLWEELPDKILVQLARWQ